MSDKSAIEWTEATWNPVTGCSKVSPGCANCYAETLSLRWQRSTKPWTPENAAENVHLHPDRLDQPLRWKRPRMIFVNSMSDLFHELVPFDYIAQVFETMKNSPQHTFQILTKRHERLSEIAPSLPWPQNVWMGVSIENARWALRADRLRDVPSVVRFVSAEPLLGSLSALDLTGIHWLIVGGESGGKSSRPMHSDWARELRDHCLKSETRFFFKQFGSYGPCDKVDSDRTVAYSALDPRPEYVRFMGMGPKSAGKVLDGREWCEFPESKALAVTLF